MDQWRTRHLRRQSALTAPHSGVKWRDMTKIADIYAQRGGEPLFICDFSPPRGAAYHDLDLALSLEADCFSVPYNPGKSVYANSAIAAHSLKSHTGKEATFTLAGRDTNILAAQSLLLGASLLRLDNVIIVRGDDFTLTELRHTKAVNDYTTTDLIRSIGDMNKGIDYRGRPLSSPTDFCIGAAIDTNHSLEAEVTLTRRKIDAGAHFFITQPGFTPEGPLAFLEAYRSELGDSLSIPVFFGVQMIAPGSRSFSPLPQTVRDALSAGATPASIAIRAIDAFLDAGITTFYLMPPILPGGARDYQSAQQVLNRFKASADRLTD